MKNHYANLCESESLKGSPRCLLFNRGICRLLTVLALLIVQFTANSQINYSTTFSSGLGTWVITGGGGTTSDGCATSGSIYTSQTLAGLYGEMYSGIGTSNGGTATLSYRYKVVNTSGGAAAPANFGRFEVQFYNSNQGAWITLQKIGNGGDAHTPSTSCVQKSVVFTPVAGPMTLRFVSYWGSGAYNLQIDDISVVQGAAPTAAPVCASGFSPANGTTNVNVPPVLSWSATPDANRYDLYFGTLPDPSLYATNVFTNSYAISTSLSANTTYYWKVVPRNNIGLAASCPVNSFVTGSLPVYCTPAYSTGCNDVDIITNTALGTLSNSSNCGGYVFYTNLNVPSITQGQTANINLTVGNDGTQYLGAWIDFNKNGQFEAGEGVVSTTNTAANSTRQLQLTVPANAALGQTILRVRGGDDVAMTTSQACGATNSVFGETEDYIINITCASPTVWYADIDADGFGNPLVQTTACLQPAGYVANNTDCNDAQVLYADADADGFGSVVKVACGGVANNSDCNDNQFQYLDADADGFGSNTKVACGVTNNSDCNDNQLQYLDADGDGFGSNTKVACGVTNNTDCNDAQVLYADADGDGFGSTVKVACGGVANNSDCNDNQLQYLDADGDGFGSNTKVACGVTNNFDCNDSQSQYLDADGDGFGSNTKVACGVTNNTDCNDAQILYADADGDGFGSAVKVACGGVANNSDCNDAQIRYQDNDVDGFGSTVKVACGGVTNNSDCNDALTLYADLDGDGFGSNVKVACIGVPNKTDCNDFAVFYQDLDGDGFGSNVKVACGTVTNSSDCNDSQLQYQDFDGDGFGSTVKVACGVTNSSDCNDNQFQYLDADGDGFGSNIKVACGVSNHSDCNDALLLYADADGDGYGSLVKVACGIANNSDCDDTKATIHPGAVEIGYNLIDEDCDGLIDEGFPPKSTVLTGPQCNTALQAIDSQLIADLVAGAQGYQWRVTALTGPNAGQVQFLNTLLRVMKLTQLGTYAYATTYKVEVAVYYAGFLQPYTASNCTVTTPVITTSLMNCSQTLLTMSEVIYANNVPYATGYRFRISDGVNTTVLDRSVREFRMNLITAFQPKFGRQYTVEISVRNTDGVYLPYGAPCTVNTPVFPTTSVQDSQCDDFSPENTGVIIYATSYPGAIAYVFNLSGPALPEQGIEVLRNTRSFKLSDFSGLVPGATYNVRVRLIFNYSDIPGPYGKICTVVVPGSSRMMHVPFTAVAYPNPFSDSFNLNVTTSADSKIAIRIYDMTGRLLESRSTEACSSKTLTLGSEFPSGVYNVIISQGDETKTIRMIKR